jgi:hypothetical protein
MFVVKITSASIADRFLLTRYLWTSQKKKGYSRLQWWRASSLASIDFRFVYRRRISSYNISLQQTPNVQSREQISCGFMMWCPKSGRLFSFVSFCNFIYFLFSLYFLSFFLPLLLKFTLYFIRLFLFFFRDLSCVFPFHLRCFYDGDENFEMCLPATFPGKIWPKHESNNLRPSGSEANGLFRLLFSFLSCICVSVVITYPISFCIYNSAYRSESLCVGFFRFSKQRGLKVFLKIIWPKC